MSEASRRKDTIMKSHNASWAVAAPVVFLVLWSSGFVFLKLGLQFAEPLTFLAFRYICVIAILVVLLLWMAVHWPTSPAQWLHLIMVGLLLHAGYFSFTYLSLHHGMSAGGVALITSQQPILVGLLAPIIT